MWRFVLVLSLLSAALSWPEAQAEEKKWRWGDGERSANARQDREPLRANDFDKSPSARYEVFDNSEGNYHTPGRPHDFRPPVDYQERPGFGGGRPDGGGHGGVLTGPVPSWQRPPQYQEFDKCKCTEKFNCQSPGISYGHCDVGKKYCCYNTQGIVGSPVPSRPQHSIQNGILSGPGGPIDYVPGSGGFRPPPRPGGQGLYQQRPPHGPGILVGPGGPSGVNGRPPSGFGGNFGINGNGRPQSGFGQESGVLVGPGGPTGIVGRPPGYGRPQSGFEGGSGVLVGPGGPTGIVGRPQGSLGGQFGSGGYNRPGFGYGRSAKDVSGSKEELAEK